MSSTSLLMPSKRQRSVLPLLLLLTAINNYCTLSQFIPVSAQRQMTKRNTSKAEEIVPKQSTARAAAWMPHCRNQCIVLMIPGFGCISLKRTLELLFTKLLPRRYALGILLWREKTHCHRCSVVYFILFCLSVLTQHHGSCSLFKQLCFPEAQSILIAGSCRGRRASKGLQMNF